MGQISLVNKLTIVNKLARRLADFYDHLRNGKQKTPLTLPPPPPPPPPPRPPPPPVLYFLFLPRS